MKIPVVGGKVSLYNETKSGPIKPSPVIGTLGLIENKNLIKLPKSEINDSIFIIGMTNDEMGGSEYYEYYHKIIGGKVPHVNLVDQSKILDSIVFMLRKTNWISAIHDCSKGGMIVSLLEISIQSNLGFIIDIKKIPTNTKTIYDRIDYMLFSETHNRFIISTKYPTKVKDFLMKEKIPFGNIGMFTIEKNCIMNKNDKVLLNLCLSQIIKKYDDSLSNILEKNVKDLKLSL